MYGIKKHIHGAVDRLVGKYMNNEKHKQSQIFCQPKHWTILHSNVPMLDLSLVLRANVAL